MSSSIVKRLINSKLVEHSCIRHDNISRSYSAASAALTEVICEKAEKKKKKIAEWEKSIVKKLSTEHQNREKEFRLVGNRRRLLADTVNCVLNENVKKLFGTATNDANLMKITPNLIFFDQYFAVVLKYSTAILSQDFISRQPHEWSQILYYITSFLSRFTPHDNVTAIGYLTTLKIVENFIIHHEESLNLEQVNKMLWSCKRTAGSLPSTFDLTHNQLLFYPLAVKENASAKAPVPAVEIADSYDPNLELVKSLCEPAFSPDYNSPFVINQRSKMDYVRDFEDQLKSEMGGFLKVENFTRLNKAAKSMEDYIEEWNWKEKIRNRLEEQIDNVQDSFLKQCFSNADYDKCAEIMLNVVHSSLSEGQGHLSVSLFQNMLALAVLRHMYSNFLEKINLSSAKVTREIFSHFLEYFCDHKIAQIYSIRQWWNRCCSFLNVDSTLALPCSDFANYNRKKVGEILCTIVMEECTFPYKNKAGRQQIHALKFGNVSMESTSNVVSDNRKKFVKMVAVDPNLIRMIKDIEYNHLYFSYKMLPFRVPPRPWIDKGKNGPFYTYSSKIIRALDLYKDVNVCKEFSDKLTSDEMARPVFDALNDLGSTPWMINGEMLDLLTEIFAMGRDKTQEELLSKLSVPLHATTFVIPEFTDVFGETANASDISTEEWRHFFKERSTVDKSRNEMNSLWAWLRYRVALARHYRNDILFFPHNMDFRGRVYPVSPHLNHMGDDINRCILKFAKGKRLGKRGLYWLKLHVVNITGLLKKKSIAERIEYFDENLDKILDSANNPLNGGRWWLESDDPWQTLAACKELRDALKLDNPEDFISHLPIHQDGSCNGLQHYAALGRDLEGALEVNLCPADKPADVYSTVAARVEERRIMDENNVDSEFNEIALKLRAALPEPVPRKVVKQTVMTTVYGVTDYGARQQIKKQLKALGQDGDEVKDFAAYLTKLTLSSLNEAFEVSMQIKEWLRTIAKVCYDLDKPVEWTTPLGMPVMQPYLKIKSKHDKVIRAPVLHKQINAFPPNYVHSLDSTHMMLTTLHCRKHGITFAAVHDCFWTHASTVDIMNKICREQFIEMNNQPLIENLAKEMRKKCLPAALLRKMDEATANAFTQQLTPSFEFGKLDISQVKDSVYFFS